MFSASCLNNTLDLLDKDIAVTCEHKLTSANLQFLDTLHPSYTAFPQNREITRTDRNTVSILVRKTLLFSISCLPEREADRVIGLKTTSPTTSPVYIFGDFTF